jgi:peroxiredoxin Q/BCP
MLKPGAAAPDFESTLDDGTPFRLSDALKTSPVVLYFYPKDFTGGCTKQACSFRDRFADITEAGALLLGVSGDSEESHARFRDRYELPFRLIADPEKRIIEAYDARGPLGLSTARVTYVIDQSARVRKVIRHDFRVSQHVPEVIEALRELAAHPTGP